MNIRYKLSTLALGFCLIGLVSTPAKGQISDVGAIIQAGANDASLLAREYLAPAGKGFGAGLNAGWFNSAKTHQTLGFDISIKASLAIVPDSDKEFDVTGLSFQRLELESGSPTTTPTLAGDSDAARSSFVIRETVGGNTYTIGNFTMPEGTGVGYVPTPMIQASVGLIKNTDVTLRYFPEYENEEYGRISLFGLGVKHELNQWLPGGKLLPVDISVQAGFTNLEVDGNLDVPMPSADDNGGYTAADFEGQKITTKTSGWTANVIVGKTLPILSVYGGVGIESATMEIKTVGNYPVEVPDTNNPGQTTIESIAGEDLFNFEIESDNKVHALAGIRIKLAFLTISADYTLSKYPMANAGIGFSFR